MSTDLKRLMISAALHARLVALAEQYHMPMEALLAVMVEQFERVRARARSVAEAEIVWAVEEPERRSGA
jgi:hypothetical protein